MTISSQTSQESSVRGKVKCTPLQGAEYLARCAGATPAPKYNNLEEWFQDNSEQEVPGETENVEVVRTFYTYRPNARSDVEIWYADGEFGFYEGLPKRVADLDATHINVDYPRRSGIKPRVELYVHIRDRETGQRRPICVHELITTVIHDDDEWKEMLPKALTQWQLIFPKGESWGIIRIVGYPESPGPSRNSPWVDSFVGAARGS